MAPRVDDLRVFGCLCYVGILPKGYNFQKRARKVFLIGYSDTQKLYKLYEPSIGIIFISRDCDFQ